MFAGHMHAAIAATRSLARLDELAGDLWKAWGSGVVTDEDAGHLSAALEARRLEARPKDTIAARAPSVPRLAASIFPPPRPIVSPDRRASMDRRRRLACSGPLPPALACRYTVGELAVLRIVGDEVRAKGACALPLAAIAARAGVCLTLARRALRNAASDGLIVIQERRRQGQPNLPNLVRIISREWRSWIERGRKEKSLGCTFVQSTDTHEPYSAGTVPLGTVKRGLSTGERARSRPFTPP